jgi:hypothetical protein
MTEKEKAQEIFNQHYLVLFDSDSDKGEECLVSLLAIKASLVTVNQILSSCTQDGCTYYWTGVKHELEQL